MSETVESFASGVAADLKSMGETAVEFGERMQARSEELRNTYREPDPELPPPPTLLQVVAEFFEGYGLEFSWGVAPFTEEERLEIAAELLATIDAYPALLPVKKEEG